MTYTPIRECRSFSHWLFYHWDFHSCWSGPYKSYRIFGYRIFGFEFEYKYLEYEFRYRRKDIK